MPASSIGALNSWGLYLIASAALLLVLSPLLFGTAGAAREGADWRNADGVRAVLDNLRPGTAVRFSYGMSGTDAIHLRGGLISCDYGGGTVSLRSRWALPDVTLLPAVEYTARVNGGRVEVTQTG